MSGRQRWRRYGFRYHSSGGGGSPRRGSSRSGSSRGGGSRVAILRRLWSTGHTQGGCYRAQARRGACACHGLGSAPVARRSRSIDADCHRLGRRRSTWVEDVLECGKGVPRAATNLKRKGGLSRAEDAHTTTTSGRGKSSMPSTLHCDHSRTSASGSCWASAKQMMVCGSTDGYTLGRAIDYDVRKATACLRSRD